MTKAVIEKFFFDTDDLLKDRFTNYVQTNRPITIRTDLEYASDAICKLDVYYPADRIDGEKSAVLLNIHGGGWITGDKHWRRGLGKIYADMGLFTVIPNYGISPQYRYHEAVKHLFYALQWIEDHAEEYGLDTERVFVTGDSAGAQLACLLAAIHNRSSICRRLGVPECSISIKGGILVCGAYDFKKLTELPIAYPMVEDMTGYKPKDLSSYEFQDLLYAVDWVDSDFPPRMLIAYGTKDAFVGGHEKLLCRKLDALGIPYELYGAKGTGEHCFHLFYKHKIAQSFFRRAKVYFEREGAVAPEGKQ